MDKTKERQKQYVSIITGKGEREIISVFKRDSIEMIQKHKSGNVELFFKHGIRSLMIVGGVGDFNKLIDDVFGG